MEVVRLRHVGILWIDTVSIGILKHIDWQPRRRSIVGVHASNNYVKTIMIAYDCLANHIAFEPLSIHMILIRM